MTRQNKRFNVLRFFIILILCIVIFFVTGSVLAMNRMNNGGSSDTLEAGTTIEGPGFFTGDIVRIDGDVNGTTFASGEEIQVNGNINGSLFVAGQRIIISGEVSGNIYGAGNVIQLDGQSDRDVFLAGERVTVEQDVELGRDLFAAGMDVRIEGAVSRHMFGAAETFKVNATVGGNANLNSENLTLGDSAMIEGDLIYESPEEAETAPNATVAGTTDYTQRDTYEMQWRMNRQDRWLFTLLWSVWSLLSALIVWLVMRLLRPNFWLNNTIPVGTQPLKTIGFGLLALIATPLAILLLLITIIGIPMGIILTLLYAIALYISKIIVALFIGASILRGVNRTSIGTELLIVLLGLFLLELVTLIPYVGRIVRLLVVITGLGGLVLSGRTPNEPAAH